MRDKDIFISRCLNAAICIFVLVILPVIVGMSTKEEKKSEKLIVCNVDSNVQSKPDEDLYCLSQDIGNGIEFLFHVMQEKRQDETGATAEIINVKIYRKGSTEPFQQLEIDHVKQDTKPFVLCDLNADGYLDLIFGEEKSSEYRIFDSYLWSVSQQKYVCGSKKLNGYNYYAIIVNEDNRSIQVGKTRKDGYENYTYQWSNETDCELVKSFCDTRTDDGVSVRIVSFYDGEEQVLMDCEYDTEQFPYYFERYAYHNRDVFYEFYIDNPVWENIIHIDNHNKTYRLYYAQNIQYDSEYGENITGYEGHIWVVDEETRILKRLSLQSKTPYITITWEETDNDKEDGRFGRYGEYNGEPMLLIQYADNSSRICTLSEILQDPMEAVYEKSMQIDFGVKEFHIDTVKYDAITDGIYKDAYYRAISGQDMVRTLEGKEVYLKGYWFFQGDSLMEMEDEIFLENLIDNTKFYYLDFDGDGLPELVMDIIGDGLHILKYLPDEEIVEIFWGYERTPYYHLLGSGQLYYRNNMLASKALWEYDIVDANGQDSLVIFLMEDADYKPHKEDDCWDVAYWVYLDEELGLVQIDEKSYKEIAKKFFKAVEHAVTAMTFEEVFGERL